MILEQMHRMKSIVKDNRVIKKQLFKINYQKYFKIKNKVYLFPCVMLYWIVVKFDVNVFYNKQSTSKYNTKQTWIYECELHEFDFFLMKGFVWDIHCIQLVLILFLYNLLKSLESLLTKGFAIK